VTRHQWELPRPASVVAFGSHRSYKLIACIHVLFVDIQHLRFFKDGYTNQGQVHLHSPEPSCSASAQPVEYILQLVVALTRRCCLTRKSSFEVRFGDHPVDFIDALSKGGFNRILVDLVDLLVNILVHVSVECLPKSFGLSVGLDCRYDFIV